MTNLLLRFLIGGTVVSLFAILGDRALCVPFLNHLQIFSLKNLSKIPCQAPKPPNSLSDNNISVAY
jgi:hypothetical protein